MQSSPFPSSAAQQEDKVEGLAVPARSIILAREEDLEAAKETLESLHSIHIYSLQPSRLQNIQSLSECNHTISTTFSSEDPLVVGKQYGVIQNGRVRRRTARRPLGIAPSIIAAKAVEKKASTKPQEIVRDSKAGLRAASSSSQDSKPIGEAGPERKPSEKTSSKMPALKKERSDIFKSFSKPKSSLQKETTDSSAAASPVPTSQEKVEPEEDHPMKDVSDDDGEGDFVPENKADPAASTSRSQRAEQLRRMMDEDDENEEEDNDNDADEEIADTEKAAALELSQESAVVDNAAEQHEPTPEPAPVVSGGRRRGRRKVMKKKTTKDEEGYLVTKEEAAWESFSEAETDSRTDRTPFSSAASSKARKSGSSKPGQGNIMSFFGKK